MIKPNEIRLGNWVNAPRDDQSPFRIDLIEHQSETYCKVGMNVHFYPNPLDENQIISAHPLTWESKDLEHIVLTEEILLKCGFKPSEEPNKYLSPHEDAYCDKNFESLVYDTNIQEFVIDANEYSAAQIECKSLHRLQNLFFALTGEELEYRADK